MGTCFRRVSGKHNRTETSGGLINYTNELAGSFEFFESSLSAIAQVQQLMAELICRSRARGFRREKPPPQPGSDSSKHGPDRLINHG